jgi:hypothetical protein
VFLCVSSGSSVAKLIRPTLPCIYFERRRETTGYSSGESCDDEGIPHKLRLLIASSTPIQRHVKVKDEANLNDPAKGAFQGPELHDGKPSRPVPRRLAPRQRGLLGGRFYTLGTILS